MANEIKGLAKDTAIYGLSSIIGKFLNWCLVPLYSYVLTSSADYGVVTNLYAWTALILVILTYGMETGLFRFLNKEKFSPNEVYSTTIITLFSTSLLFALICSFFAQPIANVLGYNDCSEYILMLAAVVAMDAFGCMPFAYLRYKKRPLLFAGLKMLMIFTNIIMNVFFLVVCPYLHKASPDTIAWFYDPNYGVGYVFVSNLISTTCVTLALLPYCFNGKPIFKFSILKAMLRYSLPLLLLGIVGIMNQTIDKILFPFLFDDKLEAATQLGIYGACFKVAMVLMMFTQAFRYAYEPFVFTKNRNSDNKQIYADSMKYYILSALVICVGMIFYLDILKWIIREDYWSGLVVIPIVLITYLFQGVYFNMSLWYKLTDKTYCGAVMSSVGLIINVISLIVLVPLIGFMGAALASLFAYIVMMIISYFWGNKVYPVNYNYRAVCKYFIIAILLMVFAHFGKTDYIWLNLIINTILFIGFIYYILKTDRYLLTACRQFIKK